MTEQWSFDEEEESKVTAFMSSGCGCTLVNKGPCSALFSREHYAMMRADAAALTWSELNMVVMGGSNGTYSDGDHEPHHSLPTPWAPCLQENIPVLHGLRKRKLELIKRHYLSHGLVLRVHGNTGRTPAHALVMEDVQNIITFVMQYSEANAILLPGCIPGYKRSDIQILPSSTTKRGIWMLYEESATQLAQRHIAFCTFCHIWKRFLQHVVVARPMTDLCATCQKNSAAIIRSVNLSEEEKSEALKTAEAHIMRATCEWSLYRTVVKESKDSIHQHYTITSNNGALSSGGASNGALSSGGASNGALSSGGASNGTLSSGGASNGVLSSGGASNGALSSGGSNNGALSSGRASNGAITSLPSTVYSPPPPGSAIPSGSGPATVHYSFDFAQQVHYPHNPLQPGPMYFKTARKCAIFGVCCEGLPRQISVLPGSLK